MKITKAREVSTLERYLLFSVGIFITAIGTYFFKFPNNFSTGGVSGLSLILGRLISSEVLTPSVLMFILNTALLGVGFIFIGREFAFSTVYCSMLLSVLMTAMEKLFPIAAPLTTQPFLELCFAVLLPGIGSAILFHLGGSSGGTDIIAMILRKHTSMNIGSALMVADSLITVAALFFFGAEAGLYSILGLLMKSTLVDYVGDSFRTKKCFQIITDHPQPIVDFIVNTLHRSATLEDVHGAYTNSQKTMIVTVMNRSQALALRKHVHLVDPHAFMIITASTEIVGKGFLKN
ncbi:MAG: YitT family protein [Clostridia bacterium]|nr:YitT family protein [Clostridia bacterium]